MINSTITPSNMKVAIIAMRKMLINAAIILLLIFLWHFLSSPSKSALKARVNDILLRQKENIRNIIALAEKNDLVLSRGAFDRDWWKDGISTTLYLRDTGTSFDVVLSSDYSFYVSDFDDDDKRFFENLLINNSFNYFNDIKSHSIKLSINNDIAEFSFILSDGDNYYSYIKDQVKFCNKKNDYKGVGLNNTFLSRINNAVVDKDNNIVYYCPDDISIRTFW